MINNFKARDSMKMINSEMAGEMKHLTLITIVPSPVAVAVGVVVVVVLVVVADCLAYEGIPEPLSGIDWRSGLIRRTCSKLYVPPP